MPTHNFAPLRGTLHELELRAEALARNRLGDPARRRVVVYTPPEAARGPLPLVIVLAAYSGSGLKLLNWRGFGESLPQRVERLVEGGHMPPAVFAFPDCFTSLGGNQYLDSPILGDWSSFLRDELLEALADFPILPGPAHRGLVGHSSGGYGALVQAMLHGEHWGAIACHSGDMGFDLLYRADLPRLVRALETHGGDPDRFLAHTQASASLAGDAFFALMLLAMSASYDPPPAPPASGSGLGLRVPVDLHTCELDPEAWARWRAWDPLVLASRPAVQTRLRALAALYFDCGNRDEYRLHFGARRLTRILRDAEVPHVYEEYEGGHSGVGVRYDRSLPLLVRALSPG